MSRPEKNRPGALDRNHLKAFVTVADELHFGRAADRLHISQPPLTRQISALETRLGFSLFDRHSRRVDLTAEGREFLVHAQHILDAEARADAFAQRLAAGSAGGLTLRYASSVSLEPIFIDSIARFSRAQPDVRLDLAECASTRQWAQVADRQIDIGLCRSRPAEPVGRLRIQQIGEAALMAAVPTALAGQSITVEALAALPLINYPDDFGSGLNTAVTAMFAEHGHEAMISVAARDITAVIALVAAGQGVAVVPACAGCIQHAGVRYVAIESPAASLPLYLLTSAEKVSVAANRFVETIKAGRSGPKISNRFAVDGDRAAGIRSIADESEPDRA